MTKPEPRIKSEAARNRDAIYNAVMQIHAEGRPVLVKEVAGMTGVREATVRRWITRLRQRKIFPQDIEFIRMSINNPSPDLTPQAIRNKDAVWRAVMSIYAEKRPVTLVEVVRNSGVASTTVNDWLKRFRKRGELPRDIVFVRSMVPGGTPGLHGLPLVATRNMLAVQKAILKIHSEGRVVTRMEVRRLANVTRDSAAKWMKRLKNMGNIPGDIRYEEVEIPYELPAPKIEARLKKLREANFRLGRRVTFEELMVLFPDGEPTRREKNAGRIRATDDRRRLA